MSPAELDDDARVLLMCDLALAGVAAREAWVDYHLVGVPQTELAGAYGITEGAVSMRVKSCERALQRAVRR